MLKPLVEFSEELRALWGPFGGGPMIPGSSWDVQVQRSSDLTFLLFYYVPVEGAGPLTTDLDLFNISAQDAATMGYKFTSARLVSSAAVRRPDGIYVSLDNPLTTYKPPSLKPA